MKAQARLLDKLCQSLPEGRLEWIGLRSERRGTVQVVESARAVAGQGLEGDHRMTKTPLYERGFLYMAHPERFELPTKWFEATYSIQLSYGCKTEFQNKVDKST